MALPVHQKLNVKLRPIIHDGIVNVFIPFGFGS